MSHHSFNPPATQEDGEIFDEIQELMEFYASKEAIHLARQEKENKPKEKSAGTLVKGFPLPQRELDLHGFNVTEALFELGRFINIAIQQHLRTVRIITGKGLHSKNMVSVLPQEVEKKLAQLRRDGKILAFKREKTGGSFAVYLIS